MSVVLLADVKLHLNITVTTYDTELQTVIDAAEAALGNLVGPLAATAKTVRVTGGGYALVLPVPPAVALTSVTPADGTALTLAALHLELASAVVTYNSGARFSARYYDVVYNAGRTCPDDLKLAVKELVRHLWASQRGPSGRPGSTPSDGASNTLPGAGYLLPNRVQELIAPHLQAGLA